MNDLTKGPIAGHLIRFASFIALTTAFQTLYFLVDLYFVGQVGRDAIAGVGLAGNVAMVTLALGQSLGIGATALIAQAMGAKDRDRAETVFNQAVGLSVIVGLVFFIVAFSLRGVYTRAFAADADTAAHGAGYLAWFVPAMGLQFFVVALGSALRGIGDMKHPTMMGIATVLVNIVLAPVLIAGWGSGYALGAAGAGLATFIAVVFGAVAFSIYFRRPASPLRFRAELWMPNWKVWRQMLGIGLPSGGEFALIAIYMTIVYDIIQGFGPAAQAGFGIGARLMQAMFLPAVAIGFATSPVVGQNFGARQPDRVRQAFYTAATLSAGVMLVITLLCHIAPASLIGGFSTDPAVIGFGAEYLRIVSWNFVASGIIFTGSSTLQGIGNTRPALLASAVRLVLFALPAYLLASHPGFEMRHVWYLSTGSVFVHCIVLVFIVRRQFKERLSGLRPAVAALALAFAFGVPAVSSAQSAPPPTAGTSSSKWEVEAYGGVTIARASRGGTPTMPAAGAPIVTSSPVFPSWSVPSWYFGDGAAFLNNVATQFGVPNRLVPLDDWLNPGSLSDAWGGLAGVRVRRPISGQVIEFGLELTTQAISLSDDLIAGLDATATSFQSTFGAILATGPFSLPIVNAGSTALAGSSRAASLTASLVSPMRSFGAFSSYAVLGGGITVGMGEPATAGLLGRYRFQIAGTVPIDETDSLSIRVRHRTTFVGVAGGGVSRPISDRLGVRIDARIHFGPATGSVEVDATPSVATSSPAGFIESFTYPNLQFSNNASTGRRSTLGPPALAGAEVFSGGWTIGVRATAGVYFKF